MADAPPTDPRDVLATLESKLRRLESELRTGATEGQPRDGEEAGPESAAAPEPAARAAPAAPPPQPAPAPQPAPPPQPAPEQAAAGRASAVAAERRDAGVPAEVVVEAEPFGDLAALEAFRRAVAAAPGARDVYLRSFDSGRAVLEVRLGAPDDA